MNKYIVVHYDEAKKKKYPGVMDYHHDWCYFLYETDGQKPIRLVGSDSAEPEDKILIRSFSWVVEEVNKLSEKIEELEADNANLYCEISDRNE
jgi:hypothetical protein